jgi:hypothetical protein
MDSREAVRSAVLNLVMRTTDLDMHLTDEDAMRVRDLRQAVGEVFDTTTALLRETAPTEAEVMRIRRRVASLGARS